MKEQKKPVPEAFTQKLNSSLLENRQKVLSRPGSLRPMKSLVKIKSLKPNSTTQVALAKPVERSL
jgi:hypothetical protein